MIPTGAAKVSRTALHINHIDVRLTQAMILKFDSPLPGLGSFPVISKLAVSTRVNRYIIYWKHAAKQEAE